MVTATGGTSPYTYQWIPSGGTNVLASGLSAGSYSAVVTDNMGNKDTATTTISQPTAINATISSTRGSCLSTGSATVAASGGTPPYTYAWVPYGGMNATGTGLSAGNYTVEVTDNNGCVQTAVATITQPPSPTVTVSGLDSICYGNSDYLCATVTGGSGAYTYSWAPGGGTSSCTTVYPTLTTTYTLVVTDANGCAAIGLLTVAVSQPPTIFVSPSRTSICAGLSVTMIATATNDTGSITWQPGNLTGPAITVSPSATTTYTVSASNLCGVANATATIYLNTTPPVSFSSDLSAGCSPLCIQFRNLTTGNNNSWIWTFGDGDTTYAENPIYCYWDSGHYNISLTVISDSGCSSTLYIPNMIKVYGHPKAAFTLSPQPASILAPTIQFTDHSTDVDSIRYWWWNFGDNTTDTVQNPSHTYHDTGTFCARLIVMNIHGCIDSVTNCLYIGNETPGVYLYPTIGNGNFTLKWFENNSPAPPVTIRIVDVLGQEVYNNQLVSNPGVNLEQLNLQSLASATYFLRMQVDNKKTVTKFWILHYK